MRWCSRFARGGAGIRTRAIFDGCWSFAVGQFDEDRSILMGWMLRVEHEHAYSVRLAHRADDAFIDQLAKAGVACVPFFPLGGLTPLQSSTLSDVARSLESTPLQVALAWLLQRAPNILLIPGTSSLAHLHENLEAAELTLPPAAVE